MQRSRTRPDPVSCQSCRSKKLRCNRAQPCSNCATRRITCNFLVPPQRRQPERNSTADRSAEILERIERLESLVLPKHIPDDSHLTKRLAPTSSSEDAVISGVHQEQDRDLHLLENVGIREDSLLPSLSKKLAIVISSTHEILETQTHLQQPIFFSEYSRLNDINLVFPVYRAAILLFESYESNVDHVCRILHIPTTRSLIKTFYLRISRSESIQPGQASLLLSIFALSAFFYQPFDNSEVATTERDAVHLSKFWSKGALDVLDHSHRNTSGTLEDIQACILMSYVTYHLDGFSARGRLLSTTAASIARDLRLHRLDADSGSTTERDTSIRVLIDHEVKRRVFWHIAATDWLQSTISGPQEGTYFINPNHVNVRLPKDCNDDDVVLGGDSEPIAGPQPTGMTFYLARVRLAHLCRELTDTIPLETSKLMQMPYEHIIALDKRLEDFLSSLPFFFRLDVESREQSKSLETMYPKIPMMRYCIATAAHSRRCRLHQKLLLRQSSNPRYAYSRQACLESARAVIQVYEDHRGGGDDSPHIATARMGIAVHFTHLALVVMVMDLCFNRGEDEEERKAEVKAALQMLEHARDVSPLLSRSLDSLSEILQKHRVYLPDLDLEAAGSTTTTTTTTTTTNPNHITGDPVQRMQTDDNDGHSLLHHDIDIDIQTQPPPVEPDLDLAMNDDSDILANPRSYLTNIDAFFDDFHQIATTTDGDGDGETNLDDDAHYPVTYPVTWDNLFSALDSRPF